MAEVIFAVMVLGIGLILLAAAFPVGIKQASKTQDMTNAALIAQHAYDQITKVVASGVVPDAAWNAVNISTLDVPGLPLDRYGNASPVTPGKALAIGFLDGAKSPTPDLRAKLLYPVSAPGDCGVQHPQTPGLVANTGSVPIEFVQLWGYRLEGPTWYENVQWVYPADRRYYWYAFYRQMYEDPTGYPNPLNTMASWAAKQASVQSDHMTRRTYRVSIVACKAPNQFTVGGITYDQIQPPMWFRNHTPGLTPTDYASQWASDKLTPFRFPQSGITSLATYTLPTSDTFKDTDTTATVSLQARIAAGQIKRGGIVIDGWGNVYQIVDLGTNWVRLDRSLLTSGATVIADVLPLWFNPNAIAVFPTIVTKQADLP